MHSPPTSFNAKDYRERSGQLYNIEGVLHIIRLDCGVAIWNAHFLCNDKKAFNIVIRIDPIAQESLFVC